MSECFLVILCILFVADDGVCCWYLLVFFDVVEMSMLEVIGIEFDIKPVK